MERSRDRLTAMWRKLTDRAAAGGDAPPAAPPPEPVVARHAVALERVHDEHFVATDGLDIETYIARCDLTAVHHLIRYRWAASVLAETRADARLLDLGCGSGYGAFELAGALPRAHVVGVDYDTNAITSARAAFARGNLVYRVGDPLRWDATIGPGLFDTVTCFDVLEHVEHRELFMEALVAHLTDDAVVLFSTPSAAADNDLRPGWEFHRIEYGTASLYDFLRRYFATLVGSERDDFPARRHFTDLHARGVPYVLKLNPVLCSGPIRVANPFRARADGASM
jgi:2-polyprenyl-3-methyl-5-hydroxy-6-metoxy-1,4-benzoquinol methylase